MEVEAQASVALASPAFLKLLEFFLSDLYYPSRERSWTKTGQKWVTQIGLDGLFNIVKEFWPDINHIVFHGKYGFDPLRTLRCQSTVKSAKRLAAPIKTRQDPRPLTRATTSPLSILHSRHGNSVGKPVAPLRTAGAKEFAPSRVIELANPMQRRGTL